MSGRLWLAGATAVTEEPGRLVAGFDDLATAEAAAAAVGGTVEQVDGGVWLDAWRAFAETVRVPPLVVHPAWTPAPALDRGDVLIEIDPGRVFGHGGHPTTRLCLAELVRLAPRGTVLDLGCGSGVLSIAAVKLGAARVDAVDTDPAAVDVTLDNASRNAVVVHASTDPPSGSYDVVVANIGAATLIDLAPLPGRTAVLSGFLVDRVDDVLAAYAAAGSTSVTTLDGWAAVTVAA